MCGHYPVQCSNKCGKTIKRQHLKTHISNDCPLKIVDCDFSHVGCEVKLPHKDMVAHVTENVIKHVSLHAQNYKQVVSQLDQLKEENKQLKQQVAKLTHAKNYRDKENEQLKQQVDKLTQDLKLQQICTPICPVEFTMTYFVCGRCC